jgi:hypothetical protein
MKGRGFLESASGRLDGRGVSGAAVNAARPAPEASPGAEAAIVQDAATGLRLLEAMLLELWPDLVTPDPALAGRVRAAARLTHNAASALSRSAVR